MNIVAGCKPWSEKVFDDTISAYPGSWVYVDTPEKLLKAVTCAPEYIFFLHWNWRVPDSITTKYECVCFHPTDLPYGRGGTPVQNLILLGHEVTTLSAIRMTDELDEGPIYMQTKVSLEGSAEEIYYRLSDVAAKCIGVILAYDIVPIPQEGEVVLFQRRKPSQSKLSGSTLTELYNFIRMLDAEGYPHAFIEHGGFRFSLRKAVLGKDSLTAEVTITEG
jgi:methionyl-tRNA formyltransferase